MAPVATQATGQVKAGGYLRISYDWEGKGLGVERQRTECLDIARRRGWTIIDWYVDNDIGASKRSKKKWREHYHQLLEDIESGRINAVVIWMEDRLRRQVIELAEFLKVCDKAGLTRIASAGGEFDLSDPDQRTMLYIKAAMAEAEIEKMSARMRSRNQQSAEHGNRHLGGKRPFGEAWHGKQAVSEEQAALERRHLREAGLRIIAGDSLRGIVTEWMKLGVTTPSGGLWHNVNLRRTLLSPRVVGLRAHNGMLHEGDPEQFTPIFTREEWEAIKAILEDPVRYKYLGGGQPRHLLTGVVYCGLCGTRLTVRRRYGKRRYYCPTLPPLGGCGKIQRVAQPLEHLIIEAILTAVESKTWERLSQVKEDPVAPLYEQLARDQGLLDRLEDKVAQELIKPATAKRNRTEIERRMQLVRREIARKRGDQVIGLVPRNLRKVWPNLSLDRQRAIIKAVLVKVSVYPQPNSVVFDPERMVAEWRA